MPTKKNIHVKKVTKNEHRAQVNMSNPRSKSLNQDNLIKNK
jgi:hypothetical protein